MRSPKIIATAVEELNKMLDEHPAALQQLLQTEVPVCPDVAIPEGADPGPTLSVMDVLNALMRAIADGKEIATSWSGNTPHSTSVLCGFTERRVRRTPLSAGTPPAVE